MTRVLSLASTQNSQLMTQNSAKRLMSHLWAGRVVPLRDKREANC